MHKIIQKIYKAGELTEETFGQLWDALEQNGGDYYAEKFFDKLRVEFIKNGIDILI